MAEDGMPDAAAPNSAARRVSVLLVALLTIVIVVTWGLLRALPRYESPPVTLVGSSTIADPVGDYESRPNWVPPFGPEQSWLDAMSTTLTADGKTLTLEITMAGPLPTNSEPKDEGLSFKLHLLHGKRPLYTIEVGNLLADPSSSILDEEIAFHLSEADTILGEALCPDGISDECRPASGRRRIAQSPLIETSFRPSVTGDTIRAEVPLDELPKLLWGTRWWVETHGYFAKKGIKARDGRIITLVDAHDERMPEEGFATLPDRAPEIEADGQRQAG